MISIKKCTKQANTDQMRCLGRLQHSWESLFELPFGFLDDVHNRDTLRLQLSSYAVPGKDTNQDGHASMCCAANACEPPAPGTCAYQCTC